MTPAALDFSRAQLLVDNKELALIVCGAPLDFVFDGRPRCDPAVGLCSTKRPCTFHKLERSQLRFTERRTDFLTTRNVILIRVLARELPKLRRALRRGATGYRDTRGAVRMFDQCPHGRPIQEACERCAAEAAECDAL